MLERQDALIGTILGEYRLIRRLGSGTFGTVYLAESRDQQTPVAIKVLRTQLHRSEDFRDFINEARVMRLQHPHIVPVLDFGVSRDNVPYLVLEYAAGGVLRDRHPRGTRLALAILLAYTEQLALALQYAHDRRLIHRDIKPENMLLRGDGTLLLSDFGIAKVIEHTSLASSTRIMGTPAYMAPEQSQGKPTVASDQYALAVVVYEWISGQRPFQGSPLEVVVQHRLDAPPPLTTLVPDLPLPVERIVLKALAKDPAERFATVQDFATALRSAIEATSATISLVASSPSIPLTVSPLPEAVVMIRAEESPTTPASLLVSSLRSADVSSPVATSMTYPPVSSEPSRSIKTEPPLPVARRRPFSQRLLLIGLIILLLIAAGLGTFSTIGYSQRIGEQNATATAANGYNAAVASKGIQFGFDASHSRYNPYEHILSPLTVPRLKSAWTGLTGDSVGSSPVVANGIVYVGSHDDKFYAFKAAGCGQTVCSPLWTATTGDFIDSSPAVANGIVYVGSDDDKFYAFKADGCGEATCLPLWTATTGNPISSSPAIANGIVYVGSGDHKLYAFKADGCGEAICPPLWTAATGNFIDSAPSVANGVVYTGSTDGKFYAFKADGCGEATCLPLWTATLGYSIRSSPAVANRVVYIGSDNNKLYAFKADGCGQASCPPLWTAATGNAANTSPAVANGVVYIGSEDNRLYAFKAIGCGGATCLPLWTANTGNAFPSSPFVANGVVYVGSYNGKLYAFKADGCEQATCSPLWSATTGNPIYSSPVVANGVVYVGSSDDKLYAFHL